MWHFENEYPFHFPKKEARIQKNRKHTKARKKRIQIILLPDSRQKVIFHT